MHKHRSITTFLALAFAAAAAPAQNLLTYRPAGAGSDATEFPSLSPAFGGAGPGIVRPAFAAPARPAMGAISGATEVDNTAEVVYSTNGFATIERRRYPRLACGGGAALPALPIPAACQPVTGMAVDPVSKNLFLTNGATIFRVDPLAGMAILCSFPAAPLNILSGLDYDPANPGQILAVSTVGEVATYNLCGALVGFVAPTYAFPGGVAVGIAQDKSGAAGGNVYVAWSNGQVYDHTAGLLWRALPANQAGLAYLASPVILPVGMACGAAAPDASIDALATTGKATFGFTMCNAAAGTPAAVVVLSPAMGVAPPFWLGAPLVAPFGAVPVVGASANVAVPLGLPAGAAIYQQWAFLCAAGGFGLSSALQIEVSR